MESQPQNPEFRIYPENFHPCCFEFEIRCDSQLPVQLQRLHVVQMLKVWMYHVQRNLLNSRQRNTKGIIKLSMLA